MALVRALACIIIADARRKGAYADLYLGSIKLPACPSDCECLVFKKAS